MAEKLSALDAWALAQIIFGDRPVELPTGMSSRAAGLAIQIQAVSSPYRRQVASNLLKGDEMGAVMAINPDASSPFTAEETGWKIIHARDLYSLPRVTWIIRGEIPERGLTVIFGESGAGKSFIGLDYALQVAQFRRVIYIPTEGESGYLKRVAAWCAHHRQPEGDLYFVLGSVSLFERNIFDQLIHDLAAMQPEMVVIDTLAMAAVGIDENSARDMGIVMRACRRIIREIGASVVLVHHTNKGGMIERGSNVLRGNADVMIRVSPADDLVMVECSKTKDDAPFPMRYLFMRPVSVEGIGDSLVPVPADAMIRDTTILTPNQRKLIDVLVLETNRDGCTIRDLESQTGLSISTVNRTLSNLKQKGMVGKGTSGSYALTPDGLKAAGIDPVDPPTAEQSGSAISPSKQGLDPVDPPDPALLGNNKNGSSGSRGSTGSTGSLFPDLPPERKTLHYKLER